MGNNINKKVYYHFFIIKATFIVLLFTIIILPQSVHAGSYSFNRYGTYVGDSGTGTYGSYPGGSRAINGTWVTTGSGTQGFYWCTERDLDLGQAWYFDGTNQLQINVGYNACSFNIDVSADGSNWVNYGSYYGINDGTSHWLKTAPNISWYTGRTIRYIRAYRTADQSGNAAIDDLEVIFSVTEYGNPNITESQTFNGWSNQNQSIYIHAWDTESGISSINLPGWSGWASSGNYTDQYRSITLTGEGWYGSQTVTTYDNAGNSSSATINAFGIDKTPPTVPAINANRTGWGNTDLVYTIGGSTDALSGVNRYEYSTDNANWKLYTGAITVSNEGWGNPIIYARAIDNVGNVSAVSSCAYGIDKTPPTLNKWTVTGYQYQNGSDYWVKPNTSISVYTEENDVVSGITSAYIRNFSFDGSIDNRMAHDWNAHTNNQYMTSTNIAITNAVETYSTTNTKGTTWTIQPQTLEQNYYVQAAAYDYASNLYGYSTLFNLRIDGTPPTITTNLANTPWGSSNVSVTLTAADTRSGVKSIFYAWSQSNTTTPTSWNSTSGNSISTSLSTEGTWYLWSYAIDNVGNASAAICFGSYNIDKSAPSITANPTSTPWGNSNVNVTLTASDTFSGIKNISYAWSQSNTITPTSWTVATSNSTVATQTNEGQWYLWYYTTDNVNISTTPTYSGLYKIDKTPPISSAPYITNIIDTSYDIIVPNVSDSLSGVASVKASTWTDTEGIGNAILTVATNTTTGTNVGDGNYKVHITQHGSISKGYHSKIIAYDNAGNQANLGQVDTDLVYLAVNATLLPNPCMAGQQVTFTINTSCYAKYLNITFPTEIASLDSNTPINLTIPEQLYYTQPYNYIVPLDTPKTLDSSENRLLQPYTITITAKKADGTTATTSVLLDVQGSVLDGIKTETLDN